MLEGEPQVFERDDPVEARELLSFVRAVAGRAVHVCRLQQPDRVVVAQHAHRHLAVPGEVSDAEHDSPGLRPDTMSESSADRSRPRGHADLDLFTQRGATEEGQLVTAPEATRVEPVDRPIGVGSSPMARYDVISHQLRAVQRLQEAPYRSRPKIQRHEVDRARRCAVQPGDYPEERVLHLFRHCRGGADGGSVPLPL